MSIKKFSKILFCRFYFPEVEPLANWEGDFNQAKKCVKLHNDTVIGPNGDFDNEFWFLETKIRGETTIITSDQLGNYPANDPDILAKLEAYLNFDERDTGNAQSRGENKQNKRPVSIDEVNIIIHLRRDKVSAENLCAKLNDRLGSLGSSSYAFEDGKHKVFIQSQVLSKEALYKILNEAKRQK